MTRWAIDDLAGRLLEASRSGGDKWEVVNIPAILDGDSAKKVYTIAKNYPMVDAKTRTPTAKELKEGDTTGRPSTWAIQPWTKARSSNANGGASGRARSFPSVKR